MSDETGPRAVTAQLAGEGAVSQAEPKDDVRSRITTDTEIAPPSKTFVALVKFVLTDKILLPCLIFLVAVAFAAVAPSVLAPMSPYAQELLLRNSPPGTASPEGAIYWLGTDQLGRDVLSRLIYGGRTTILVGLGVVVIAGTIGVLLGVIAGYFGGRVESLIMRLVDIQMSFPNLLFALFVLFILGPGFWKLILVLTLSFWITYTRVIRSMVLSMREGGFVEAARALGCSSSRIVFRHILPNVMNQVVVLATLSISAAILAEAGLSFLGLGIQAPESSWGLMLAEGQNYLSVAWWLVMFPGMLIFLTCLAINLFANGISEFLDPKSKSRWIRDVRKVRRREAAAANGSRGAASPTV